MAAPETSGSAEPESDDDVLYEGYSPFAQTVFKKKCTPEEIKEIKKIAFWFGIKDGLKGILSPTFLKLSEIEKLDTSPEIKIALIRGYRSYTTGAALPQYCVAMAGLAALVITKGPEVLTILADLFLKITHLG
ncbi:hypothetical protein [Methanoregula sp.]|uniref:hypothetical protein n=1 Tax=Methanoregula sp. TaxID=2052170 RepID=UPI000CB45189|nr:hypothetical protein [Methanoregula sp.]PKG31677.1 MAG: hypothetical protein CW742_12150 [Methanoregula sp.]